MVRTSPIATLSEAPSPDGAELAALPDSVEWLEVCADLTGDIDPDWLRSHFRGRLLYSSSSQDGYRLEKAARFYDRIEIQAGQDLSADLWEQIPPEKRLVSWYGHVNDLSQLHERFDQVSSIPASLYKLVTTATTIAEEFLPLSLLKSLGRTDTIAFSTGALGFWNR